MIAVDAVPGSDEYMPGFWKWSAETHPLRKPFNREKSYDGADQIISSFLVFSMKRVFY